MLINILIICLIVSITANCYFIYRCYKHIILLCKIKKDIISIQNNFNNLININKSINDKIKEQDNKIRTFIVSQGLLLLLLASCKNEYEQFTYYYHQLYFLGVPKNILDSPSLLKLFINDCMNNKYNVLNGESPFTYKFELKENKNE